MIVLIMLDINKNRNGTIQYHNPFLYDKIKKNTTHRNRSNASTTRTNNNNNNNNNDNNNKKKKTIMKLSNENGVVLLYKY